LWNMNETCPLLNQRTSVCNIKAPNCTSILSNKCVKSMLKRPSVDRVYKFLHNHLCTQSLMINDTVATKKSGKVGSFFLQI
jgi:hypothetical protein